MSVRNSTSFASQKNPTSVGRGRIRVIEKGKRYEVRVALGRDPLTGRYRQKSVSVRGTRREAERILRGLIEESERSKVPISAAPPEARTTSSDDPDS